MATINLTYTNLEKSIVNGSGDLEKTSGLDNCFEDASGGGDGGGRSVESLTGTEGDWEVRWSYGPDPSGRSYAGLTTHSDFDGQDAGQLRYLIHVSTENNTVDPYPPDSIFVYQNTTFGNLANRQGVWTSGDLLRIKCVGGVVKFYWKNDLMYTSGLAPIYPLYFGASICCLNKTVTDAQFITGAQNPCETGTDVGESECAAPWTIPTPGAFPLPANGGPTPAVFQEVAPDWGGFSLKFADGKEVSNTIQTAAIRRWIVEWDGLSQAEAAVLDAHYVSTRAGLKFSLTHPYTSEVLNGTRYLSYRNPGHRKIWAQARSAELIKYIS